MRNRADRGLSSAVRPVHRCKILIGLAVTVLSGRPLLAQYWISLGLGSGSLDVSCQQCGGSVRQGGTSLDARIGGAVSAKVRLGAEILRWNSSTANPSAALSDLTVNAFVHPWGESGAFLEVGLGECSYVRSVTVAATGFGVTLGVGYDITVARGVAMTPMALVVWGAPGSLKDNQQFTVAQALSTTLLDVGLNASFSFPGKRR